MSRKKRSPNTRGVNSSITNRRTLWFQNKTLRPLLSEQGLIKSRVRIEVLWIQKLISKLNLVDETELELIQTKLKTIIEDFDKKAGENVKALERSTNHDVKAVEYYLRDNFKKDRVLNQLIPYIHFGCTSEDINNLLQYHAKRS